MNSIPWSTVFGRREQLIVFPQLSRATPNHFFVFKVLYETLYEAPDLSEKLVVERASKILQKELHPTSVYLLFPLLNTSIKVRYL
ncbi:hypothetical protein BDB01DRAFT_771788, partial [Pilobolus umbonatus]